LNIGKTRTKITDRMENMSSYGTQIYRLKRPWTNISVLGNKNLDTKEQNSIDPKDIMRTPEPWNK
jgi:hypothetical protein